MPNEDRSFDPFRTRSMDNQETPPTPPPETPGTASAAAVETPAKPAKARAPRKSVKRTKPAAKAPPAEKALKQPKTPIPEGMDGTPGHQAINHYLTQTFNVTLQQVEEKHPELKTLREIVLALEADGYTPIIR